jgi:hypothetical protein
MSAKTLFYLDSDKFGVYDASVKATPITLSGDIKSLGSRAGFKITRGFIALNRKKELDELNFFTIEAKITVDNIGSRMNILEGQSPAIAFYVEADGKLVGGINTAGGWRMVDSGATKIVSNTQTQVRFLRSDNGDMQLEIEGKPVGTINVTAPIANTGSSGFKIGMSVDGTQFQFKGKISDLRIARGGVNSHIINMRKAAAETLQTEIKNIFKVVNVKVELDTDVSYARLQPIKDLMNAAGVKKLSDLGTLKITTKTVMNRGKVIVAPSKPQRVEINWKNIASEYSKQPGLAEKRNILATFLPNKNSVPVLKNFKIAETVIAPSISTNIIGVGGRIAGLGRGTTTRTGARLPMSIMTKNPTFSLARKPTLLSNVIEKEGTGYKLTSAVVLENLKLNVPANWPALGSIVANTYSFKTIPVGSAVIIANVLDLTNVELLVEPNVETLYIIAEKVVCGNNAKITWRQPGGSTPPRLDNPDLNGRSWSGINTKQNSRDGCDGGDGLTGESGISGAPGTNAPNLEMWVKSMTAIPNIDLNGEDGIKGGKGQRGGKGGNGAHGGWGTMKYAIFKSWDWCSDEGGDGGDGGNGGDGGRGGKGGNGGNGGKITIGVLEGTLDATVKSREFMLKNQMGRRGRGGDGGEGGRGGRGGRSGNWRDCTKADNGHSGATGQPGVVGSDGSNDGKDGLIAFFEFSNEAWEEMLERPWISEVSPTQVFPGDNIIIRGSSFTSNDLVVVGNLKIAPVINVDESVSAAIPQSIDGGIKEIYIQRKDGSQSNRQVIWIKPQLDLVEEDIKPGTTVSLTGKAFLPGASVLVDGLATTANVLNAGNINFVMPGTGGTGSSGREVMLQVLNPDGMVSNMQPSFVLAVLEIPFKFGVHNLSFANDFNYGVPSWSTYEDTFGAAEIWHEQLDPIFGHPILTAAFYGFYYYFLKGTAKGGLATGFCTALASLVAEKFWTGATDTTTIALSDVHKMLTAVHGKLLSRESLLHFHDQGQEGVSRVEKTYREIETTFLKGVDRFNSPLLFFIPSGEIWDSGYIDKLADTHCILPIRFVYPNGVSGAQLSADGTTTITDPDGVELYCWDCNHPASDKCKLVFKRTGDQVVYEYYPDSSTAKFKSSDGITLGMMRHGQYMLADHDLPFSGPFGLTSFVIDFLLSPAILQVTDENGLRTGSFGTQILAEIPDSHPCFMIKGCFMLPSNRALKRKIVGTGSGTYTFSSIMPYGKSLVLENVQTEAGHEDILSLNADCTQIRFTPSIEKTFTATMSSQVGDEVRSIAIKGIGGGPTADVDMTLAPDLSLIRIGNPGGTKIVEVKTFSINKLSNTPVNNQKTAINLPTKSDLVIAVEDWKIAGMKVDVVSFE